MRGFESLCHEKRLMPRIDRVAYYARLNWQRLGSMIQDDLTSRLLVTLQRRGKLKAGEAEPRRRSLHPGWKARTLISLFSPQSEPHSGQASTLAFLSNAGVKVQTQNV